MNINRILAVGSVVAIALSVPFFGPKWNRMMHLLGGVMFLGNVLVTAVWASMARRNRDPEVVRFCVRGILLTDAVFTLPGVMLLFVNGGIIGTEWFKAGAPWLMVSVILFTITGIVWGAVLVPLQKKLLRLVDAMPPRGPVPPEYDALFAKWFRWGGIATLLPLVTFVLMVVRPVF
ncbi:MAG TPA: DUF2269 family protein [Candidatus Krumholzibacteria bacterium]|nr:DUF2269 family protein [Candidatus Krumholzibacteria bacterium]